MIHEVDCGNELKNICNIKKTEITKISYFEAKRLKVYFYNNGQNVCGDEDTWELKHKLGEDSAFGEPYLSTCSKDDQKSYVFKIIHNLDNESNRIKKFNDEVFYQNKASQLGVSSPIYQVFMDKSKNFGMFVMDLYAMTVHRFFINQLKLPDPNLTLLQTILDRCFEINRLLTENGISHNDQHLNNFMLVSTNESDLHNVNANIKIIDFGEAVTDNSNSNSVIRMATKIIVGNIKKIEKNVHKNNLPFFNSIKEMLNRLIPETNEQKFKRFLDSTYGPEIIEFYDAVNNYLDSDGPHPKTIPKFSDKNTRDTYSQTIENHEQTFNIYFIEIFRDKENEDEEENEEEKS